MADTLIAYFSWSGQSARLAEKLRDHIPDSERYHILTKQTYAKGFFGCAGQARKELKQDARPELLNQLTGKQMLKYDRIILIYPIWCGTCPRAVNTFLEGIRTDRLDIFPVALSRSTDVRRSVEDIRKSAPKAAIAEGITIKGKKSQTQEAYDAIMEYLGLQ